MAEDKDLHPGDVVEWDSHGGHAVGKIERRITEEMDIKDHHVAASEDNPQYLVRSEKSDTLSAHKPETLRKRQKG